MRVRVKKMMAFDGMKRVRQGQLCEIDDRLVKFDDAGNIVKPLWAERADAPATAPATTPYPKKLPEVSSSVFVAPEKTQPEDSQPTPSVNEPTPKKRGRPFKNSGSVI